jgi:exoribonuclease R
MLLQTKDYKHFTIDNISFDDYHQANRCLPGDSVEWDGTKCILQKRGDHRQLVGLLELNSKYLYGHTSRGIKIYLFHPLNPAYPPMRVGCSERNTSRNQLALVRFDSWTETIPRGNLVRLLGPVGDLNAEQEALLWLYAKPELRKITLNAVSTEESPTVLPGKTINIDPEGCQDIDDTVTLHQVENGWQFFITIADVAKAIDENSPGDILAQQRMQTVYQNGQAVLPMLPRELSEDQLSLLPNQRRQGLSLECFWDGTTLQIKQFVEVTLINSASYTYDSIYKAEVSSILQEIASYLKGVPTSDSHEWIEQFMLLYNLEGAKILLQANAGLLRTHTAANKETVEKMERVHPDLRIFAFESAKYEQTGENRLHATLGNRPYTHLTSPLRRYADLVNQRILKAYLHQEPLPVLSPSLPQLLNQQQKFLKQYDRDLFFLKTILQETTGCVKGLVVTSTKVYIPTWKRMIKVSTASLDPGTEVDVEFFADIKKVSWKERIVFRIRQERGTAKGVETYCTPNETNAPHED